MSFKQIFIKNSLRNLNGYKYFFINTIPAILMFFLTCSTVYHPIIVQNPNKYEISTILLTKEAVFFVSALFVYFSMKQFLSSRDREFGIYKVLGMSKRNIYMIIFIESSVIGLISIIIAVIIGVVFFKFFIIIIAYVLDTKELGYYFPIKGLMHTIVRYIILFQVLPIIVGRGIVKKTSFLLMKTESEKYDAVIWKSFWIIVFLFFIALVVIINKIFCLSNEIFLATAIIGIIINYIFFNKIVYVFIEYLIEHKKFYKESFVILINSMKSLIYSIRNLLFVSTLLISMALVFIIISLMLTMSLRESLEKEVPFLYNITVKDDNKASKIEEYIESTLMDKRYQYKKFKYNAKYIGDIALISNSEYNAICGLVGSEKVYLEDKEAKILDFFAGEQKVYYNKELIIQGIQFKVSGYISFLPERFGERYNYVVSDISYNKIQGQNGAFIGYESDGWWKILNLDDSIIKEVKNISKDEGFIFSRCERYKLQNRENLLTVGLLGLVALMLYFMSTTLILSRFCNMIINRKRSYLDLISIGLSFKELKTLMSWEIIMIFLISHGIAFINISVAISFLMTIFVVNTLVYIVISLGILFSINISAYFIWVYFNFEAIFKEITASDNSYSNG